MIYPSSFFPYFIVVGIGFLGALAPLGLEIGKKIGKEVGKKLGIEKKEKKPSPPPSPAGKKEETPFWQNPIILGAIALTLFFFLRKK